MESEAIQLNHEVLQNIKISSQEYMIIKNLELFYECEDNINLFCYIINSEAEISIRLIDNFITKYDKNNKNYLKLRVQTAAFLIFSSPAYLIQR